jgi:hypothetical protein
MDIRILPLTRQATPRAIVSTATADVEPQVSPNGKWLAYASSETGSYEVYVEPFLPDGKTRPRISRSGGRQPMWRADSRELFFVGDDRRFYAVRVPESGPSQSIEPEFLFNLRECRQHAQWLRSSADGQRSRQHGARHRRRNQRHLQQTGLVKRRWRTYGCMQKLRLALVKRALNALHLQMPATAMRICAFFIFATAERGHAQNCPKHETRRP